MLFKGVLASTVLLASGIQAQFEGGVVKRAVAKRQAPEGMVMVHTVQVGDAEGNNRFFPDSLQVDPGSMVQFQFHPKNHSVSQSIFDQPCAPISQTMANMTGVRSGFLPVAADATDMPVFTMMVNDTNPIWLFCGQQPHCQNGMVMVINPPAAAGKDIETFRSAAMSSSPGSGGGSGGGSGAGAGSGGSSSSASSVSGALPSSTSAPSTVAAGSATPTQSGPLQATINAAPRQMSNAAGLSGLLIASFAIFGL
ncbi:hypothetical protein FQN55_002696 [Onygenales sp. PD_40]|nr:hypothetical protein FQN55_002696 [Onygenales sp. PD_40]